MTPLPLKLRLSHTQARSLCLLSVPTLGTHQAFCIWSRAFYLTAALAAPYPTHMAQGPQSDKPPARPQQASVPSCAPHAQASPAPSLVLVPSHPPPARLPSWGSLGNPPSCEGPRGCALRDKGAALSLGVSTLLHTVLWRPRGSSLPQHCHPAGDRANEGKGFHWCRTLYLMEARMDTLEEACGFAGLRQEMQHHGVPSTRNPARQRQPQPRGELRMPPPWRASSWLGQRFPHSCPVSGLNARVNVVRYFNTPINL